MTLDDTICANMEPFKADLRRIKVLMRNQNQIIYSFAIYFNERMRDQDQVTPLQVAQIARSAMSEVVTGQSILTGAPISGMGFSAQEYGVLREKVPVMLKRLTRDNYTPEFGCELLKEYAKLTRP